MNKSKIVNAGNIKYRTINPKYWVDLTPDPIGGQFVTEYKLAEDFVVETAGNGGPFIKQFDITNIDKITFDVTLEAPSGTFGSASINLTETAGISRTLCSLSIGNTQIDEKSVEFDTSELTGLYQVTYSCGGTGPIKLSIRNIKAKGNVVNILYDTRSMLEEFLSKNDLDIANELLSNVALGRITISKAVITSETVVNNAFKNYAMLNIIDLVNCKSLKVGSTFWGCRSLKALVIRKQDSILTLPDTDPWATDWGMFYDTLIGSNYGADKGGRIYVPRALLDAYKTATTWKDLSDKFRAIEDYTVDGTVYGELDETKI